MNSDRIKQTMLMNAKEINRLHGLIHETFKQRDLNEKTRQAWKDACAEFHSRYNALAFPSGYDDALERIIAGGKIAMEAALCFLEYRPYFFRSGYMYQAILRKIKRAPLSPEQVQRLQIIVEKVAQWKAKKAIGKFYS